MINRLQRRLGSEQGFTLIELLVAAACSASELGIAVDVVPRVDRDATDQVDRSTGRRLDAVRRLRSRRLTTLAGRRDGAEAGSPRRSRTPGNGCPVVAEARTLTSSNADAVCGPSAALAVLADRLEPRASTSRPASGREQVDAVVIRLRRASVPTAAGLLHRVSESTAGGAGQARAGRAVIGGQRRRGSRLCVERLRGEPMLRKGSGMRCTSVRAPSRMSYYDRAARAVKIGNDLACSCRRSRLGSATTTDLDPLVQHVEGRWQLPGGAGRSRRATRPRRCSANAVRGSSHRRRGDPRLGGGFGGPEYRITLLERRRSRLGRLRVRRARSSQASPHRATTRRRPSAGSSRFREHRCAQSWPVGTRIAPSARPLGYSGLDVLRSSSTIDAFASPKSITVFGL